MIFLDDIKEKKYDIISYMNFYSYLIQRCKKESKEYVDNIVYLLGFIFSNISLFSIAIAVDFPLTEMPFVFVACMFLLPVSAGIIYGIFDIYSYLTKKKTYLRELEKKHFFKNFKYLMKNHLKNKNLNYTIRKEIYFYLKNNNNKETDFNDFYTYIENKYSEKNIIKLPKQKIA